MRSSLPLSFAKIILICCFAILAVSSAFAVDGAIYTTTSTGTTVNGNIYDAKADVYLSGGPQNKNDNGLVPDGLYYFQVTDPSGSVLLSTDDVKCRIVVVANGRVDGVPSNDAGGLGTPSCYHSIGTQDDANGALPVQLCSSAANGGCPGALPGPPQSYYDTPNPGGEYKAWLTPVDSYSPNGSLCGTNSRVTFGFCDSASKTDNFKIKIANAAYVTVCKFNDQDGDGVQDHGDPLIAGWPVTATGVVDGTGRETDQDGCISFTATNLPATVTLTEGTKATWTQTAPPAGSCMLGGTAADPTACSVSGGVITLTLAAGDNSVAPYFGNTQCSANCAGGPPPVIGKTAAGGYDNTFKWDITKDVDKTLVNSSSGSATFTYTVSVTHDTGTVSNVKVQGKIMLTNNDAFDITNATVTDVLSDTTSCSVANGTGVTIPAGKEVDLNYTCNLSAVPQGAMTNTAELEWLDVDGADHTIFTDPVSVAFTANLINGSVDVTDTFGGTLGTVKSTDPSPTKFTYDHTFTGVPSGTCTKYDNTATFTATDDSTVTGSARQEVKICVGADLTVSKDATPSFTRTYNWDISKSVDQTKVETSASSVKFNYTVVVKETGFTDSGWQVNGTITVSNPNDWEVVTASVGDAVDNGGNCTVAGGTSVSVAASSSVKLGYTCTYSAAPSPASFTNKATATWDKTAASTPDGSASGTATGSFAPVSPKLVNQIITPQDSFNGGTNTNLCLLDTTGPCTLTAVNTTPYTTHTYKYSRTINNASAGACASYTNIAIIKETGDKSSQTVTVCNTGTGALTMGFWKNSQGQNVIKNHCNNSPTTLHAFLTFYNPYKDDAATTCAGEASYVATVINGATCSTSGTCNTMLRAQMLATALDVYFSTPGLGGNQIGAKVALGGVAIDLSHLCSMADSSSGATCSGKYEDARPEFGICTGTNTPVAGCTAGTLGTTVSQMLGYANFLSALNGSPVATPNTGASWYKQNKSFQVFAKDGFDNINNQIANIAPSAGSPSF